MIIKGNPGGNVGFWAKHLMRDDTNERAEVVEMSGLLADDLPAALREMQAIAKQSRSEGNFMYQANINPLAHEHLTPEQWKEAIDTLEKNLGLEGHQRIVVEHVKEGREHRHIIWNRVDVDTLRVADMGGNWRIHTATARELEDRFDLTPTPTPAVAKTPALELWEIRAAERSGIDPAALKAELTELWRSTDSGKAFAAAIDERGYILARGDRRDFCIIDQAGDAHSLARRLDGVRAKDVRERMGDIDRDSLPTVAEARAIRHGREIPAQKELTGPAAEIRLAWSLTDSGPAFAAALEDKGMILARVTSDEARASQRAKDFAKEIDRYAPAYRAGELVAVNEQGNVYRITPQVTGDSRADTEKRLATIGRDSLPSITDARQAMQEARRERFIEQKLQERPATKMESLIGHLHEIAPHAGAFKAALFREGITIVRVDAEGKNQLESEIYARNVDARIKDPETKEIRAPKLKEGEIVALNRYGNVHRLNPYRVDLGRIEDALGHDLPAMGEAQKFLKMDLTAERAQKEKSWQENSAKRAELRDTRDEQTQKQWRHDVQAERARVTDAGGRDPARKLPLSVINTVSGTTEKLTDFVTGILSGATTTPTHTPAELDQMRQIQGQRRALAAIESIAESMERGEGLKAEDIQHLTPTHLENIKARGDDYVRELIERTERDRQRYLDWGREREL